MRWLWLTLALGCSSGGDRARPSLDGFLGGVDLAGVDLAGGDLAGADLAGADLARVDSAQVGDLSSPTDGGLDPLLGPANGSGSVCMTPGSLAECPGYAVCRFYTTTEARCDPADQSNPGIGALCNTSQDCDLMYLCYKDFCRPFCDFTDPYSCGFPPGSCVDVGFQGPTHLGACSN
jgi:hypothetical protein